jgi:RHS repeat-associated protein
VTYGYDANGNRTSAADGTRTITTTYDRLNRPLTVTLSDDASAGTSYTYDFSAPAWTDPSGTYTASLDPFGRETGLLDPIHGSTAWTTAYRADGQPASRTDPAGNTTAFAYDALGRLTAKTTTGSGGSPTRAAYAFTYNRAAQRVAETSTVTGDATNGDVDYTYDPLGRLTGYARDGADAVTYGWQAVPNRSSVQVAANPAVTTTFDAANRPLSDSAGGSYASDDDGRLTARPGQTLEWDSLGRLVHVLSAPGGATLATYTYDPLDRLRLVDHGGSDRTRFRYVGLTTSVAQVVDDTTGSVIRSVGTSWSGELLMDWTGAGVSRRLYGTNGHKDVTWIAGPDGTVAGSLRYDPWGTVVASAGASLPDFRFQSSWHDATTSLSWVVTRWYAESLGRFVSEDSLLGQPEQPASRHLYAYGAGEPVARSDPDGAFWYKVKSGDTISRVALAMYGSTTGLSWIANANPGGRFTPVNIWRNYLALTPGQCIWIPWRNGTQQCQFTRLDAPYGSTLYSRYRDTSAYIYLHMVADRECSAGGVGCYVGSLFTAGADSIVLARFAAKVDERGPWDYKYPLQHFFGGEHGYYTAVEGDPVPDSLYYDAWTNIHYGYVGRGHGIPSSILRTAAILRGGANTLSDRYNVDLGIGLWSNYGRGLTVSQLRNAVRSAMSIYRSDPDTTEVRARLQR